MLLVLGLAVDLRWLEPAWPRGLAALGKILLLDAGIFGFLVVRRLEGVGFDLRLTVNDLRSGLGEYLPVCVDCDSVGAVAGVSAYACDFAFAAAGRGGICFYVFVYCDSGGAFLSRDGCRICWSGGWEGRPRCC